MTVNHPKKKMQALSFDAAGPKTCTEKLKPALVHILRVKACKDECACENACVGMGSRLLE